MSVIFDIMKMTVISSVCMCMYLVTGILKRDFRQQRLHFDVKSVIEKYWILITDEFKKVLDTK